MILISIYFQELRQSYDLKVDENAEIEKVIAEAIDLIAQQEHLKLGKAAMETPLLLCDPDRESFLDPGTTLYENGIAAGTSLLLV